MSLRLAVATEDFGTSLKHAINKAAACQVHGVRLNTRTELNVLNTTATANRQILLYVKERRMRTAGLMCSTRHALYDQEHLEPRLDVIRRSMSLARQLETDELIVRCGSIPDPDVELETLTEDKHIDDQANPFSFATGEMKRSPAAEFSMLCEILNDLAEHGNNVGCTLNLQLTNYDLRLVKRLLDAVKTGPMKIVFDSATIVMTGAAMDRTYRDLYENIGYVRARDAVSNVDGAGVEVGVGDGIVDWTQLLPTLVEAEYSGWICVERTGGDNRIADVESGVSYLKTLIPVTGN